MAIKALAPFKIMHSTSADLIFANEADPAFRRRARWIENAIRTRYDGARIRLADIGCGRGFYFPLYHALGLDVSALERDPEPLAIAQQRGQGIGAYVVQGTAEALPFGNGEFSVAVMSEILEHLDEPVAALREARRVLADDGMLLVTVPHANYPFLWDPINWVLERTTGRPIRRGPLAGIWANHVRLYTPEDLSAQICEAGFRVEAIVLQTHHCLPFVHNIVYGLGRPLLERRLLPRDWAQSAERGEGRRAGGRWFNPVALGIRLIHWFDSANGDSEPAGRSSLNICLVAVKAGR